MRDIFFTILAVWIVYRIWNGIQVANARNFNGRSEAEKRAGDVSVDYVPPKKNNKDNDDGEYVDYEEVK
ncbi:MAG: hypothetical protein HYU69_10115 [Bacteroidetes bacterium]|nr:hypothetical protein [Bacteroidota bacterium]